MKYLDYDEAVTQVFIRQIAREVFAEEIAKVWYDRPRNNDVVEIRVDYAPKINVGPPPPRVEVPEDVIDAINALGEAPFKMEEQETYGTPVEFWYELSDSKDRIIADEIICNEDRAAALVLILNHVAAQCAKGDGE